MMISAPNSAFSQTPRFADHFLLAAKIAFAAAIIFIPFRWRFVILARHNHPQLYTDYTDFLLFIPDVFILISLALWGCSLLIARRKISFAPTHIWLPLLGLTLAAWASLKHSFDMQLTLYHALRFSLLFIFTIFVVNEIRQPVWIVLPVSIQMLIQSPLAIAQSLLQTDLGLQILGEHALDPLRAGTSILESGGARFLRAYGLSDHPNILGGCLAFGLLILLAALIYHLQNKKLAQSWLIAGIFILASLALLLTFSRSAWVAFLIGSLMLMGIEVWRKNFGILNRIEILAFACLLAASPFIYRDRIFLSGRFNAGNSFSENRVEHGAILERIYLLDAANRLFVDHALTGVGLGASVVAIQQAYPIFPMNYQPPHLTLLMAALETGIFGAGLFLILTVYPILLFIQRISRLDMNLNLIASASLLSAILIVGLFDYYTWGYAAGRYWQWLAWGSWASAWKNHHALV